jgi:transposase
LRRAHVRGHENVLKRLLVHASAFNLGLWMRSLFGIGTPRALQGRLAVLATVLSTSWSFMYRAIVVIWGESFHPAPSVRPVNESIAYA